MGSSALWLGVSQSSPPAPEVGGIRTEDEGGERGRLQFPSAVALTLCDSCCRHDDRRALDGREDVQEEERGL